MKSLSRWLLLTLIGVVTISGAISGWLSYSAGVDEASELFDAKLAHSARVLRSLVDDSLAQGAPAPGVPALQIEVWSGEAHGRGDDLATPTGHAYETKLAFQVVDAEGRVLLRSTSAPDALLAPLQRGFHNMLLDGVQWRGFALPAASGRWYLAGERFDVRGDIAGRIADGILRPLILELPILALLIWGVIGIGRRALQRVIGEVERRAADRLDPIDARRVPDEIAGLVAAINRLLAALSGALQRERRFTADAAHELRTPLAALRVHLANLRAAASAEERQRSQDSIEQGLRRLDRLVGQLLTLSRLEPGAPLPKPGDCDLAEVAREAIGELLAAGLAPEVELELQAPASGAAMTGDAIGLGILLRNLVDNALRYTPAGGQVRIAVVAEPDVVRLQVDDSGPGIAAEARQRVLDRFHRELGSGVEGSGLGLSIAQRVAEIHGARLQLAQSPTLGGLQVSVTFPRRSPG